MTVLSHPAVEEPARQTTENALPEVISVLEQLSQECAEPTKANPAYNLAKSLHNRLPVIYGAYERTDAVALRWRGQIQENAKQLAFSHLLPEMNHNEINGWQFPLQSSNSALRFCFAILMTTSASVSVSMRSPKSYGKHAFAQLLPLKVAVGASWRG